MKKIFLLILSSLIITCAFGQGSQIRYAPVASPHLTGTPLAPTPSTADNSTKLATTAYVQANFTANSIFFGTGTFLGSGTSGSPFTSGFLSNNNVLTGLSIYKDSTASTAITSLLALDNRFISSATTDLFSPGFRFRANRFSVTDQPSDFIIYHEVNDNTPVDQLLIGYSFNNAAPTPLLSLDRFGNWNVKTGGFVVTNGNLNLGTAGNHVIITEGTGGYKGQTTLVAGTKAITITGLATTNRAFVSLVSQAGTVTTTQQYEGVCTSNTLTINAVTNAGTNTINTLDISVINYVIY